MGPSIVCQNFCCLWLISRDRVISICMILQCLFTTNLLVIGLNILWSSPVVTSTGLLQFAGKDGINKFCEHFGCLLPIESWFIKNIVHTIFPTELFFRVKKRHKFWVYFPGILMCNGFIHDILSLTVQPEDFVYCLPLSLALFYVFSNCSDLTLCICMSLRRVDTKILPGTEMINLSHTKINKQFSMYFRKRKHSC